MGSECIIFATAFVSEELEVRSEELGVRSEELGDTL